MIATALTDDDVRTYIYCPAKYYLHKLYESQISDLDPEISDEVKRANRCTLDLPGKIMGIALSIHLRQRLERPLPHTVWKVWDEWFTNNGVPDDAKQAIYLYGEARNTKILPPFFQGDYLTRGRQKYVEPRMSSRFRSMMKKGQLDNLEADTDKVALKMLNYVKGDLSGIGPYSIAAAYADSLLMADRFPLPQWDQLLAVNEPVSVQLESGREVGYRVDLMYEQQGTVFLEVHNASPAFYYPKRWIGRDSRAILGELTLTGYKDKNTILIYRHLMTGEAQKLWDLRSARVVAGVEYALSGIEANVFPPAFLSGDLNRCFSCSAKDLCLHSGDLLEWLLPGLSDGADRLKAAIGHLPAEALDLHTIEVIQEALTVSQCLPTNLLRYHLHERRENRERLAETVQKP